MMKEHSAGGVVIKDEKVLLLRKYYGDWVLPKGKIEKGETTSITAKREVEEESGVKAEPVRKIGYARYYYYNQNNQKVSKRVDYYLMSYKAGDLKPQNEEGFALAEFIDFDQALINLKHDSEKNMVKNAIKQYKKIREKDDIFKWY